MQEVCRFCGRKVRGVSFGESRVAVLGKLRGRKGSWRGIEREKYLQWEKEKDFQIIKKSEGKVYFLNLQSIENREKIF